MFNDRSKQMFENVASIEVKIIAIFFWPTVYIYDIEI